MPGPVAPILKFGHTGEEDFKKSKLPMVVRVNGNALTVWNQLVKSDLFLVTFHFFIT